MPERLVIVVRVNSSDTVGWMPTVSSKALYVKPHLKQFEMYINNYLKYDLNIKSV